MKNKRLIIITVVAFLVILSIGITALITNDKGSKKKEAIGYVVEKNSSSETKTIKEETTTIVQETTIQETTTVPETESITETTVLETIEQPLPSQEQSSMEPIEEEPTTSEPIPPQNYTIDEGNNSFVDEVIRLVNIQRTNGGLSPLAKNNTLCNAADVRAVEIISVFDHKRPDGRSWSTVINEFNISFNTIGENIASGYSTPEAVVNAWMNSPGHRQNIMNPSFTEIGIGHATNQDSYGNYWVQLFKG